MIVDDFFGEVDLIVDEYDLNSSEKMLRICLTSRGTTKQSEMILVIEGDYKMFFEPKEDYVLTVKS